MLLLAMMDQFWWTALDERERKRVLPFLNRKLNISSQLPFVDGSFGLPENMPVVRDRVSGLPENTHRDTGGSSRFSGNMPGVRDRISRLPESVRDNGGWVRQLPGSMPDSDDGLSGLPENAPGTAGKLPYLPKDTPAKAVGFLLLPGNAPEDAGAFFARRSKEGNTGAGGSFGWFSRKGVGGAISPTGYYDFWPAKFSDFFRFFRDLPAAPFDLTDHFLRSVEETGISCNSLK
jgi:hypothetical protein